eukprot:TRINITY_DN24663_c0_g2_i1.p1 TRINITY_DN24663_c0_g2~~TRINITY_DN24663_c0_g2_i1.p1  ORF type:complete len:156 (+),score=19.92 TRINITY_DN24663_c0_g2_i1:52-519(+)
MEALEEDKDDDVLKKRAAVAKKLAKTRLCKQFAREGICSYGEACRFAHDSNDLNQRPDWRKTRLCRTFEEGSCPFADCNFAHGLRELRWPLPPHLNETSASVADTLYREEPSGSSRQVQRETDLQNAAQQSSDNEKKEPRINLAPLQSTGSKRWQ